MLKSISGKIKLKEFSLDTIKSLVNEMQLKRSIKHIEYLKKKCMRIWWEEI